MKDKIKQFEIPYQISYEDALNYQICKETDKEYLECANNFYRNIFEKINENMTSYHFFDSLKFGASEINHNTGLLIRKDCTSYLGKIIKKLGVNVGAKKCRLENFKYEQQKLRKLRESNNQDDTVEERYKNLELREQEEEKAQYQEEKYDQKEQQEEEDYQQTQYLEEYQQTQYQEEQNEQKQVEEEYQETQYLEDQQTQQEEEQCQEKQCSKEQKEQRCQEENIVCDEINSNTMLEEEIKSLIYDLQQSQQQSQQLLELDKNVFRKDETLLEIIQRKNSQQDLNNNQQQFSIKNQHHSLLDNSKKFQCESNNQPVNMSNQIKQEYKDQKPKDDQFTSHKEKLENQIKDLKYQLLKTKLQIAQQQMKMFFTQYPDYIPQDSQSQQDLCYYQ